MDTRPAAPVGTQKCKFKPDSPNHYATETHNAHQVGAQELTETRLYATEELIQVLPGGLGLLFRASLVLPADAAEVF